MKGVDEKCPECGSTLDCDEVDVEVGTIRGNFGCPNCHWTPSDPLGDCIEKALNDLDVDGFDVNREDLEALSAMGLKGAEMGEELKKRIMETTFTKPPASIIEFLETHDDGWFPVPNEIVGWARKEILVRKNEVALRSAIEKTLKEVLPAELVPTSDSKG